MARAREGKAAGWSFQSGTSGGEIASRSVGLLCEQAAWAEPMRAIPGGLQPSSDLISTLLRHAFIGEARTILASSCLN